MVGLRLFRISKDSLRIGETARYWGPKTIPGRREVLRITFALRYPGQRETNLPDLGKRNCTVNRVSLVVGRIAIKYFV